MTVVFNASNQGDIHLKNDCDDDQRHVESGSEGRNMDDNSTHQRTGEETGGGSQLIGDEEGRVIVVGSSDGRDIRGVGRH